ncbi:UDP-glycosyltransferase 83A1-like [Cryptomeria japonica]|nr:UDP-glycosyltransferase 83A1-like [Cryptomeria japonica]
MISVPFEFPPMDTLEGVENGIEALAKDTGPSEFQRKIKKQNISPPCRRCVLEIFRGRGQGKYMIRKGIRMAEDVKHIKWVLFNSFLEIEAPVDETLSKDVGVYPIGPLIPPEFFHSRTVTKVLPSFWKNDTECLQWLDKQCAHSVIYISFRSLVVLSEKQLEELALGVEATQRPFLWIVRSDLVKASKAILPAGFLERESITMGVSMLCWPYHADQFVNRTYVVDVWKLCLPLHANSQRIIEQGEFVKGVEILLE